MIQEVTKSQKAKRMMICTNRVQRKMSSQYNDRVSANIQPGFWFKFSG